jgi:hypothetical protein
MSRRLIALTALTTMGPGSPAGAHCFRYWAYPWAQPCRQAQAQAMIKPSAPIVSPDVGSSDEEWSVEIVKLPEDLAYAVAVERLKAELFKTGPH